MMSKPFKITNGTRLECPLSFLIFGLIIVPLVEAIRTRKTLKLKTEKKEHRIGLYADDILIALMDPLFFLPALQNILKCSTISLYKVNRSKSYILPIQLPLLTQKQDQDL